MTVYEDEIQVRRPSVGTKVLTLACAIMAVLGSFWGIVWFIRAYVEPPRVLAPAPLMLASRDSTPVPPPALPAVKAPDRPAATPAAPPVSEAQAAPAQPSAAPRAPAFAPADQSSTSSSVADRWAPMNQFSPPGIPAAPSDSTPAAPDAQATSPAAATDIDEVVEGSVPAISGPAPLPRRKPVMTAAMKRLDPPLPRPRPDGQTAPQSVWISVPTTDDRFPQQ